MSGEGEKKTDVAPIKAADGGHEPMPEGEEEAPPGTRVMAVFRWSLVVLMAFAAVGSILHVTGALQKLRGEQEAKGPRYHCPMHPSIISDQPGDCPICSMSLVPIEESGTGASKVQTTGAEGHEGHRHEASDPYLCPMHPEETGTSADARCPVCKMKMEPRPDAGTASAKGAYWCPMHPHVTSDDPNARCPECGGMKLLPRPKDDGAMTGMGDMAGMNMEPAGAGFDAGVDGLVPIELKPERVQLIGMKTAVARTATLESELRAVGFVTADEQRLSQVTTRFAGWIEKLSVNETGQRVKKGQVLASIYSPELLTAQQELLSARRWSQGGEGQKTAAAVANGMVSDAATKLRLLGVAEHEIDQILETGQPLRSLPLRSSADGYVLSKNAFEGAYVQPGTELFRLADLSRVWVLADVYEYELSRVKVGQGAALSLAAYPGRKFAGKLAYIYPTVESSTRTIRVRLEFKNPKLELKPGMYGEVLVESGASEEAVLIPREAVVDTGELQYVFVATAPGRFEPRRVQVGARSGDDVQIQKGVKAGETVVTTGNFLLDSESSLRFRVSGPSFGGGGGEKAAPSACDAQFDAEKFRDKYEQCLACEQQHRGMGTMEEDCKNAIPKPWK